MVPYYEFKVGCYFTLWLVAMLDNGHGQRKYTAAVAAAATADVPFQWEYVDFTYPTPQARETALRTGKFVPENCVILDVDVYENVYDVEESTIPDRGSHISDRNAKFNGNNFNNNFPGNGGVNSVVAQREIQAGRRVFVTIPRFKVGTPVTFATVSNQKRGREYLLAPFPSWAAQKEGNCEGLTSAYRTQIDACGRLWVVDSGRVENFTPNPRTVCRPKVVAYDLKHGDKIVEWIEIPSRHLSQDSLLVTLAVDVRDGGSGSGIVGGKCRDTFLYLADVTEFKLLVVDVRKKATWRVANNFFYPFPTHGKFNVAGTTFSLMDGLMGLALGPLREGGNDRILYFHSLASVREGSVPVSILRNQSLFEEDEEAGSDAFHLSEEGRPSQSAAQAMTPDGILLFGLMKEMALGCWDSETPYTRENVHVAYQNSETMQFTSGVKIIGNSAWLVTNELQNYISGTMRNGDVKYRIIRLPLEDLLRGTGCDSRSGGYAVIEDQNKSIVYTAAAAHNANISPVENNPKKSIPPFTPQSFPPFAPPSTSPFIRESPLHSIFPINPTNPSTISQTHLYHRNPPNLPRTPPTSSFGHFQRRNLQSLQPIRFQSFP